MPRYLHLCLLRSLSPISNHRSLLGGCPLRGKSSMCRFMMCLKYRIILTRGSFYLHILCSGRRPVRPYLAGPSDPSTFPHSALHLPFRHLAINVICRRAAATSVRKLQRKHRKMWRNATLLMMIICRKKQRTNAKSGGTKVADRQHVGA